MTISAKNMVIWVMGDTADISRYNMRGKQGLPPHRHLAVLHHRHFPSASLVNQRGGDGVHAAEYPVHRHNEPPEQYLGVVILEQFIYFIEKYSRQLVLVEI